MSEINSGGHAFPVAGSEHGYPEAGMSLRDYFAASAMQLQASAFNDMRMENIEASIPIIASISYAMADAMIAARNKESK